MLDIDGGERPIGEVAVVSAGRGKITVDSRAAQSVMPRGMLPCQVDVEEVAKKSGVKYVTATGARSDNYGEKKVRFRGGGIKGTNSITFQVTDVGASHWRRSATCRTRVCSARRKVGPRRKETLVLEVEFLAGAHAVELGFCEAGQVDSARKTGK